MESNNLAHKLHSRITQKQIIFTGAVFHLLAAFFSIGFHQSDELFQAFEFAGYKLGKNNVIDMPWEFSEQMRSGILPLIVYTFTRLFNAISITNPFHIALFIRLVQAALSFFAVLKLIRFFEKELVSEKSRLWLWTFAMLFWCIPYFHVRLSSENFSTTIFMYAFVLLLERLDKTPGFLALFVIGFLFGFSFMSRFQMAFMIAGLFFWLLFMKRPPFSFYLKVALGFITALGLGVLIDYWLYGQWTSSWWNYLWQNFFEGKAENYGVEPFYFYISESLLQLIPPFSLVFLVAIIGFWVKFKTHVLTFITLPFIVLHFFTAHKELRFLFPILNFLPVIVMLYFQSLEKREIRMMRLVRSRGFIVLALVVNCMLLFYYTFKPANQSFASLNSIYKFVEGKNPVLYYEGENPYNANCGLNYFRNSRIATIDVAKDTVLPVIARPEYFFSEKFGEPDTLVKRGKVFTKVYASFPDWFRYLNFNGWLNREFSYAIYRKSLRNCSGNAGFTFEVPGLFPGNKLENRITDVTIF